ncbi:MAG: hypothetical protein II913_03640 [Elusimicrobiaceae bacterium]|nr:hypothetical protein [Elusimicrobiaceae bacterium]
MNRYAWLALMSLALLNGQWTVAGGIGKLKRVKRPRIAAEPRSGLHALIKQQNVTPITHAPSMRKIFNATRYQIKSSEKLLKRTRHSVVQISAPNHSTVLGTGFVFRQRKKLWIAMPFHLGGLAGTMRTVRLRKLDGSIAEQEVTIALNGTAGWHSPDISLAELPKQWRNEVEPLEIAPVNRKAAAYSVGYVAGDFNMDDQVLASGQFTHVDGQSMLRKFHIPGSTLESPISGNGYCGSVILQHIDGEWKAVGMHNGHVLDLENPAASIASSVNLARTIPQLIDNYFHPIAMGRGLAFRGWEITRLDVQERVDTITVIRADGTQEAPLYMRNFTAPYSDAHVEQAVEGFDLQRGDKLIFSIKGRTEAQKRTSREVEFVIP